MTGAQHYIEAERLLTAAKRGQDDRGTLIDRHQAMRAAAAHATLALAAATALQNSASERGGGMYVADAEQWEQACSATEVRAEATP